MFLCAYITGQRGTEGAETATEAETAVIVTAEELPDAEAEEEDLIVVFYHDLATRGMVEDYFGTLTGSPEIARTVLVNAAAFNIPPALAFAVCWEESRFNPAAVNRKNRNASIDRGLFQLNDKSFPNVKHSDFFDPEINAYYGMSHLRWCLNSGGTEIAALAMYNAGTNRVRNLGTPKNTLDYIHRVLEYRQKLENAFGIAAFNALRRQEAETILAAETETKRSRFFRLSPLSGPVR
jgi:hypothetical protein